VEINPEIVCFLISKAKEFHAKEAVVIPEEPMNSSDDWALQVLADHTEDLDYQEFSATVDDLEPDQQVEVVALMWLGRGDYDVEQWEEARATAQKRRNKRTAQYLISTPLVADYLEEGLDLLGYDCEE
jgi:hypothetical protein